MSRVNSGINSENGLFRWWSFPSALTALTSTIGIVIERGEKSKHGVRIGKPKGKIVVDKGMELIFHRTLKSAIHVNHLGLLISKQLGVSS